MPDQLVTVLIPVYNCGDYIEKAVKSILEQTYSDLQVLICDDGSTDNTLDVIRSLRDERIEILHFEQNIGKVSAVNKALTSVKGKYLAMQDADDWSEKTRIEKQVNCFNDSELAVCFTGYQLIGTMRHGLQYNLSDVELRKEFVQGGFIDHGDVQRPTICATMMARTVAINKTGGYSVLFSRRICEDIHWVSRIMRQGKGITVNEDLYNYVYKREGSFMADTFIRHNPKHLYGFELAYKAISYESNNPGRLIESLSETEWMAMEFESCKEALIKATIKLDNCNKTYLNSAAYKLGNNLLEPLRLAKRLFKN